MNKSTIYILYGAIACTLIVLWITHLTMHNMIEDMQQLRVSVTHLTRTPTIYVKTGIITAKDFEELVVEEIERGE